MTDHQVALLKEARRVQEAGYFGRSERLTQAFEILIAASETGRPVKEVELASEVFQNDIRLQSGLDSSVRALVHRLRRKLDQFYAERGAIDGMRLDIPKGTYVLQLVPVDSIDPEDGRENEPREVQSQSKSRRHLIILCALLAMALAGLSMLHFTRPPLLLNTELSRLDDLRATTMWGDFLDSTRPTIVVLGHSDAADGGDTAPHILLASAGAIRNLAPLLYTDAKSERFMTIMSAGRVQAEMIRNNNIIYLGKVDELGPQLNHIWRGLPLAATGNGTDIVDRATGTVYSAASNVADAAGTHTEYALLAAMNGPDGTRILIIAGTDNASVSQAAALAISHDDLKDIAYKTNSAGNFEALYAVRAHGPSHQGAALVAAAPISAGAWGTPTP